MNLSSHQMFGMTVGLLLCTAAIAAPNGGSSTQLSVPAFPYVDHGGYHEVLTGKWRLTASAAVVTAVGSNATIVANLPAGSALRALKVEIVTLRPAVCEITQNGVLSVRQWTLSNGVISGERLQNVPFRRGDRLYELNYYGEGECSIWFKGVVGIAECSINAISGGPELCRYAGPEKPDSEVWAYVQTEKGQRGWIRNPKAKGMSRHD